MAHRRGRDRWLLAIVGLAILILAVINHIDSPLLDEIQGKPAKMTIDLGFHISVYAVVSMRWIARLVSQLKGRKKTG